MKTLVAVMLIASCFISQPASAQPQLWDVYSTSNQPFVNVTIARFESDSLYIKALNQELALHQDSIKYLVRRNKSQFALGFLVGAVLGGVAMNQMMQGDGPFSNLGRLSAIALGVAIGGGLGGAVGLGAGADTKYDLQKLSSEDRQKLLKRLFQVQGQRSSSSPVDATVSHSRFGTRGMV